MSAHPKLVRGISRSPEVATIWLVEYGYNSMKADTLPEREMYCRGWAVVNFEEFLVDK